MANIDGDDVRAAGGFHESNISDATLALTPFIPVGDAWLNKIIADNNETDLATLTAANANRGALAKAAECYYVASLVAGRASKDNLKSGSIETKNRTASAVAEDSETLYKKATAQLGKADLSVRTYHTASKGGDDYTPSGDDNTQFDFGLAEDPDYPFNVFGGDR